MTTDVLGVLDQVADRDWWPGAADDGVSVGLVGAGPVSTERDGARLVIRVGPSAGPHDLDALLARARHPLGPSVDQVVLDLHGVPDTDGALARALARLRMRLLVHGVRVEVVGTPPGLRLRLGDGRPMRFRVEENAEREGLAP